MQCPRPCGRLLTNKRSSALRDLSKQSGLHKGVVLTQRGHSTGTSPSALAWPGPLSWREEGSLEGWRTPAFPTVPAASSPSQNTQLSQQTTEGRAVGRRHDTSLKDRTHLPGTSNEQENDGSGQGGNSRAAPGGDLASQLSTGHKRRWGAGTDTVDTFAYGANMNFLTLARSDVHVLSRDPAVVADPSIRMVFKHQGGYATLERAGEGKSGHKDEPRFRSYDGRVHGVLYRVTRADFDKLAKRKGGYLVQEIQVQTYDGTSHTALVFVSNPLFKLPQEVTPTEKYLAAVREGARDNYLDPGYQAFLSGISTVPSAGLGSEYYHTPSRYMAYSFLLVVGLITLAYFCQQ